MRLRHRNTRLRSTTVAVLLVAVLPAAVAAAQEPGPGAVFGIALAPESDTAAAGTCNEFTASLGVEGPGQGFTVDVVQALQGAATEPGETRELAFCNPQNPSGPNPTGQGAAFAGVDGNNPGETAGQPGRNTTVRAEVGPTDANGEVTFGISMSPATAGGDVTVTAWFDRADDGFLGESDPSDSSTKTWIAQQPAGPTQVDAAPETAALPAGGTHQISVTITGDGSPVQGVVPTVRIVADATGRPAGDVADPAAGASPNFSPGNSPSGYTCTSTDAQGVSTCTYQDPPASAPGTDTVVFFVDTSGDPDLPDGADPQDAVQVTWFAPDPGGPAPGNPEARNIRLCHGDGPAGTCVTEARTRSVGGLHELAALVTNRLGQPLFGIPVEFRESGPGGFLPAGGSSIVRSTELDGIARTVLTSNVPGASSIVAEISPPGTPGGFRGPGARDDECEQSAGPDGAPAGNCVSQRLTVTWQPLPVCADGADNDGDGLTDADDPVCRDAAATSELPVHHTREISMRFDHLLVDDDVLLVSGRLKAADPDDAFLDCFTHHLLKIKRLVDGAWETVGKTETDWRGRYKVLVPDRPGDYQAVARRTEAPVPGAPSHVCRRAEREKPHIHA